MPGDAGGGNSLPAAAENAPRPKRPPVTSVMDFLPVLLFFKHNKKGRNVVGQSRRSNIPVFLDGDIIVYTLQLDMTISLPHTEAILDNSPHQFEHILVL